MKIEIPTLDLKKQYNSIKKEVDEVIDRVVKSGWFILGENVKNFENEFADYCNVRYAAGVASGTDALHIALLACGVGNGDEVITTPLSAIATSFAIIFTGAKPVFVDIEPETYNIDVSKIEEKISKKTKAILPVHLYGQPCDMDQLMDLVEDHRLFLIEDACQAHGAEYKGKKVGGFGKVAAFSFYPTKNLGAYGDGGIVVTNDEKIAEKAKLLRDYGQKVRYHHLTKGLNSRLDELQAAILRVKLKKLDEWNESRRKNAKLYNKLLKKNNASLPIEKPYSKHVYHQYVIRTKQRNELQKWLKTRGVLTDVHYPTANHLQPALKHLGLRKGTCPVVEKCTNEILSLPVFPELRKKQIEKVSSLINNFYS